MPVRVIAGLGNPGTRYDGTRHNAGFMLVNALAAQCGAAWRDDSRHCVQTASVTLGPQTLLLAKPQTFMNESGRALGGLAHFYKWAPADCVVVYDEYTIPVGGLKVSLRGSAGGHNGIESVLAHLGDGFIRYRLGIGPDSKPLQPLADFVLGRFSPEELTRFQASFDRYLSGLRLLAEQGPVAAMNQLNQRPPQ